MITSGYSFLWYKFIYGVIFFYNFLIFATFMQHLKFLSSQRKKGEL